MSNQRRGYQNQRKGQMSEEAISRRLKYKGFLEVVHIETGMRKVRGIWVHKKRAAADFTCMLPNGRACIVEAKCRTDKLSLSDLEIHQRANLDRWSQGPGVALVAWQDGVGGSIYLLHWPIPGLAKGKPLSKAAAKRLAIESADRLSEELEELSDD